MNPWIKVKNSKIHGKGVFAKKDIPKNAIIIDYAGEKISKKEGDRRAFAYEDKGHVWVFSLNKKFDIDGNVSGNEARFINHCCHPNCRSEVLGDVIWIISERAIKKGEELCYDYGYTSKEDKCLCGSRKCKGYMHSD